jgi:hypothetical protein
MILYIDWSNEQFRVLSIPWIAGRLLLLGSEAVSELRAVVRQDRANVNWAGGLQALEEIQTAFFALVIVDVQEDPTASALNGDEEIVAPAKPIQSPPKVALGRFIQPRISGELK